MLSQGVKCICVNVCHMYVGTGETRRSCRSPGAGVTGGSESPNTGSGRAASVLNCPTISPALLFDFYPSLFHYKWAPDIIAVHVNAPPPRVAYNVRLARWDQVTQ